VWEASLKIWQTIVRWTDTGGTFTDFVFQRTIVCKSSNSPPHPVILRSRSSIGLQRIAKTTNSSVSDLEVVHGPQWDQCVTTKTWRAHRPRDHRGFEDVLAIGRQARPELYNLNAESRRRWCLTIFVWVCLSGSPHR